VRVRNLYVFISALVLGISMSYSKTIYVNTLAGGSNDGSSWNNAFANLQTAISYSSVGDTLWIAKGKYLPTSFYGNSQDNDNRSRTFLIKGGITLYGGFNGTETNINQRDIKQNTTILSGDLGNNDSNVWPLDSTRNENAYHVLVIRGQNQETTIDGLTITGGNANNETYEITNDGTIPDGAHVHKYGGAGLIVLSSIHVNNCTVENNAASNAGGFMIYGTDTPTKLISENTRYKKNQANNGDGGALYISSEQEDQIAVMNVVLKKCLFQENENKVSGALNSGGWLRGGHGGAIFVDHGLVNADACVFDQNWVNPNNFGEPFNGGLPAGSGGAICVVNGGKATFSNSIFNGNSALWSGGAVEISRWSSDLEPSTCELYFCTIFNNTSRWGGGINNYKCYLYGFGNIIYNNNSIDGNGYIYDVSNATSIEGYPSYSALDYTVTTYGSIYNNNGTVRAGDPQFIDSANPSGTDKEWLTFDDGLKLKGSSSAFSFVDKILPADLCDADNDGNSAESLPFDAENHFFSNASPYQAGAYQYAGILKNLKISYVQSSSVELAFERNKGGTQILLSPYIYLCQGIYQTLEYSFDLKNWYSADLTGMELSQTVGSASNYYENITFTQNISSTPKAFYRMKYSNTAPSIAF